MDSPLSISVEPTVRPATVADAESMAQLSTQLGYTSATEETLRRLVELKNHRDHDVYVAEVSGTVVGWIHVFVSYSLLADTPAEVAGLVVDEKYRGRRVGRVLMRWAETWAKEHGCRSVRLRSNVIRSRAHAFYERLGYEVTKTQEAFCKVLG